MKKNYSFFEKTMKTFVMFSLFLLTALSSFSQTTLINPAGDGGFENGATLAANNWVAVNGATDGWFVGSAPVVATGTNCGFVSATAGTGWTYSQTSLVTHVYKDFTVPAGEGKLTLNFKWKVGGEGLTTNDWDNMKVFLAPTSYTPTTAAVTGQTQLVGPGAVSGMYKLNSAAWNNETISFVGTPGVTYRLIFSWKSDGSTIVNPPAALDDVSLVSSVPGNFISIVTGNWGAPTTWDANAVPTVADNVTVANTHTVTIDAAAQASNNLVVQNGGTLAFGVTPTSFAVGGNLTVDSGGLFNVFNGTTGKTLSVAGNIINDGRINTFVGTANQLILNGSQVQTVSGTGVFGGTVANTTATNEVGVIRQLICANNNIATPNIIWNVNNIRILGTLNTTGARIALGANKIYIGNFAAIGTHTGPVGTGFIGGSISRFWTATATGTTITAGTDPTNTTSRYPFLSPTGAQRALYITRSAGGTNTTGYLTVAYTDATSITTGLTAVDGAYTVTDRADANWNITLENGYSTTTATHTLTIVANSLLNAATTNVRVMNASSFVGTHQNGTTTPGGQRTAITTAQLTGGAFYLGLNSSEISNSSITSGDWNNASTWSKGTVPVCTDGVLINAGHIVTVNSAGNTASNTTISNTGTLVISSGDLTVGCTNNNTPLTNNGTLTVSGGTLNINGNLMNNAGSTFNQSGGDIVVDGNNGTTPGSVVTGTPLVRVTASAVSNLNLSGGTITIVDPHFGVSTTDYALSISQGGAANAANPLHTVKFGNGVSTTAGGHSNGFYVYLFPGAFYYSLGNVTVDALTGTNRFVKTTSNVGILGNLTVTSGEYQLASSNIIAGNIVNNGTITATSLLALGTFVPTASISPSANAQSISGTGLFRNSATASTANLTSFQISNSNPAGVTLNVPLSVSGTLTLTDGLVNTTTANLLSLGTTAAAGTLTGGSSTAYINGPFARTIALGNANSNYINFPVGKSVYNPIWLAPSTTSVSVMKAEVFDSNTGTTDTSITSLSSLKRWEAPLVSGTITDINVRLSDASMIATNIPVQALTASGVYTNSFGSVATYVAGPPVTVQSNTASTSANYTGFLSYAVTNACTGAQSITTSPNVAICNGDSTVLTVSSANDPNHNYTWSPATGLSGTTGASVTANPTVTTTYTVTATDIITGCIAIGTIVVTVNAAPTAVTVTPPTAAICSGAIQQLTTGGITGGTVLSGSGTSTTIGNTTASTLGPNPLQNFYGGTKQQWIYTAAELSALGFTSGAQINEIKLDLATANTTYALTNLVVKMKNTATGSFVSTTAWETGLTTVKATASYTPVVGLNSFILDTAFIWNGTSNLVIEMNYSNNNGGAAAFNTARHSATSFVSTIFYRVDNQTAATVDAFVGTASFTYSSRNDVNFVFVNAPITWAPLTDLYTDAAATIAYTGTPATTVYAKPTADITYTATATIGTCTSSDTSVITVTPTSSLPTEVISACDTYTWSANGAVYTTSGIYTSTTSCVTRTLDLTINITPNADAPANVTACDSYTLPALTVGNYFTGAGGTGTALSAGNVVTSSQTIYVYAETGTTPNCTDENSFTVTINNSPVADAPANVTACDSYTLPALTVGNYFTGAGGTGTALSAGNVITFSQTIYVYAETGTTPNCTDENSFTVTINNSPVADAPANVTACDSYTLPALTVGNYFTGAGGTGTALSAGNVVTSSQTIYVYAETGTTPNCTNENSFVVTINTTPVADAPANVTACDSYTLPALTVGNYFTGAGGTGTALSAGNVITSSQTIYVYAETGTTPNCTDENSFTVTINNSPVADAPADVTTCDSYTLPALTVGNYFTGAGGTGTALSAGNVITSTQTIYVYAETGTTPNCTDENSFVVTITSATISGATTQVINGGVAADATIEDIVVTSNGTVTWFASSADATANTNPLAVGTQLVDGNIYYGVTNIGTCRSTTLAVTVTVVLGTSSFDLSQLNYYPNPVKDIFNVKYNKEIISVDVYDLTGRKVIEMKPNTLEVQLNMTNLSNAMYIVRLQSVDGITELKVYKN